MGSQGRHGRHRGGLGKLEILLVVSCVTLLFQVIPSLWLAALYIIDLRNWGRAAWLSLNFGVILLLFGVRFGPALRAEWRQQRASHSKHSSGPPAEAAGEWRQLDAAQQKELFKRMREARKKQV